jgi:hypothetical protein
MPYLSVFNDLANYEQSKPVQPDKPYEKMSQFMIEDFEDILEILKPLYDFTLQVSTHKKSMYCFGIIIVDELKAHLFKDHKSYTDEIISMKQAMQRKFSKYFDNISSMMLMFLSFVLHPCFKFRKLDSYFQGDPEKEKKKDQIKESLKHVFYTYYSVPKIKLERMDDLQSSHGPSQYRMMREENDFSNDSFDELETYLHERPIIFPTKDFEAQHVIQYWENNKQKYPCLSKMALDFLTIQLSSVASESAFSGSGRVLTDYRTRLKPENLEALMQLRSWLGVKYGKKNNIPWCLEDNETYDQSLDDENIN